MKQTTNNTNLYWLLLIVMFVQNRIRSRLAFGDLALSSATYNTELKSTETDICHTPSFLHFPHLVIALPNIASRGNNLDLVLTYSRAQKVSLATIISIFRG